MKFGPALHLVARSAEGVWRAVQATGPRTERAGLWREPPGTFVDRLGQHCFPDPAGGLFCSDVNDLRHHGIVENEAAMRRLGFVQTGGEPVNEMGAAEEPATPKT